MPPVGRAMLAGALKRQFPRLLDFRPRQNASAAADLNRPPKLAPVRRAG
jgi:hypothetical protein